MKRFSKKLIVAAAVVAAAMGVGVAFASWSATGTGSGSAKAGSAQGVTTDSSISAFTAGQLLYPGGSGDVRISLKNLNPYPVIVTDIVQTPADATTHLPKIATTDGTPACDASTGVTFTDQHSLTLAVPALSSQEYVLAGKVSMSNSSDDSCQGKTFTIPVTTTSHSNATP